jgi:hypothetical protein
LDFIKEELKKHIFEYEFQENSNLISKIISNGENLDDFKDLIKIINIILILDKNNLKLFLNNIFNWQISYESSLELLNLC